MRVLFIVPYPVEGPSTRYRVDQYLPYLKAANISYTVRPFMDSAYYKIFYKKGRMLIKAAHFFKSVLNRFLDLLLVFEHDAVFIHIEAFPLGPPFIEWLLYKTKKPIIFDFEDAVYLRRKGIIRNFFKNPFKFFGIVRMSKHIIVCNDYMKEFLSHYNRNITVIPTSIDINKFHPPDERTFKKEKVVIGWIGSHTTLPLLLGLENVFRKIAKKHKFTLKIVGGGKNVSIDGIDIINEEWSLHKEVDDFQSLDIGVYPLPDEERSKAKTPFKTVQYMSVGVPVAASKVAGNRNIVQDGQNGFLCSGEEEWVSKLSLLIEDAELRKRLGIAARKTVEDNFSVEKSAQKFLEAIKQSAIKRVQ